MDQSRGDTIDQR